MTADTRSQVQYEEDPVSPPPFWEMNYEPDDPECKHPLPGDWEFGGATGEDPRTDPRWRPVTYTYLDRLLRRITITQEPFCDHVARGSMRQRVSARGRTAYYVMAAPEGRDAATIYTDMEGALGAAES